MSIGKRVRSWWKGIPILPCPGEPDYGNGKSHYQRPLLARIVGLVARSEPWRWVISNCTAFLALLIAFLSLLLQCRYSYHQ